jgi:hypothetical protein
VQTIRLGHFSEPAAVPRTDRVCPMRRYVRARYRVALVVRCAWVSKGAAGRSDCYWFFLGDRQGRRLGPGVSLISHECEQHSKSDRTELEQVLRDRKIDSIIISGISTDVCCDTTAREAHARDLKVFFLSDGTATAGSNPTEVQQRTLAYVGALLGEVLTTAEMTGRILNATSR